MSHLIFWSCGERPREVWYVVIEINTASIFQVIKWRQNVRTHLQQYTVSFCFGVSLRCCQYLDYMPSDGLVDTDEL
jgi:hypothetical protein